MSKSSRLLFTSPGVPTGSINIDCPDDGFGNPLSKEEKASLLYRWKLQEGLIEPQPAPKRKPKPKPGPKTVPAKRKLTDEQEAEAKRLYATGRYTYKELAARYGVSVATAYRRINGRSH